MVKRGMRERLLSVKSWSGRKFGAVMLSAGAILSSESTTAVAHPVAHEIHTKTTIMADSGTLAAAIRDPATGEPFILVDSLPPATDAGFRKALQEPLVQLSLREGNTSVVYVKQDTIDNGEFDDDDLSTTLFIANNTPDTGVLASPDMLPFALDHENTHALNNEWWQDLRTQTNAKDSVLQQKIDQVAATCAAVNKSVFEQFIIADHDGLIRAFSDASDAVPAETLIDNLIDDSGPRRITRDALIASAQAIQNGDTAIYDAPRHMQPSCKAPSLLSIPELLAHGPMVGIDDSHKLEHLFFAELALESDESRAFSCLKEGAGLSMRLGDFHAIEAGHPEDDPSEAASSIVTSLLSNPRYFSQCLDRLDPADKTLLEAYTSAELDLMNYTHPQIIEILCRDPEAAAIVDYLLAIDR